MDFKEEDFADIHYFVTRVRQALKDKTQEIEDLKDSILLLKAKIIQMEERK